MTYEAMVGCPAVGFGDGTLDPRTYDGPLLECAKGHERVTWRGPKGGLCWFCDSAGRMVGYPNDDDA